MRPKPPPAPARKVTRSGAQRPRWRQCRNRNRTRSRSRNPHLCHGRSGCCRRRVRHLPHPRPCLQTQDQSEGAKFDLDLHPHIHPHLHPLLPHLCTLPNPPVHGTWCRPCCPCCFLSPLVEPRQPYQLAHLRQRTRLPGCSTQWFRRWKASWVPYLASLRDQHRSRHYLCPAPRPQLRRACLCGQTTCLSSRPLGAA
jgi:hypothetical protein